MVTLAGKSYAKNQDEVAANPAQSFAGFYRVNQNGVLFLDLKKVPFAYAAMDPTNGGCFFVDATRQSDGRTWYQHGTNEIVNKQLGIHGLKYSEQYEAARDVIRQAAVPLYTRFYRQEEPAA